MTKKITAKQFEKKVWMLEGVRIVIREPKRTARVPDYPFERACKGDMKVSDWMENRIGRILGEDIHFTVIDPTQFDPKWNITMETLRDRYPS